MDKGEFVLGELRSDIECGLASERISLDEMISLVTFIDDRETTLTLRIEAAEYIISDYEEVIQWYLNRPTNFRERYSRLGKLIYRGMQERMNYRAAYPDKVGG